MSIFPTISFPSSNLIAPVGHTFVHAKHPLQISAYDSNGGDTLLSKLLPLNAIASIPKREQTATHNPQRMHILSPFTSKPYFDASSLTASDIVYFAKSSTMHFLISNILSDFVLTFNPSLTSMEHEA